MEVVVVEGAGVELGGESDGGLACGGGVGPRASRRAIQGHLREGFWWLGLLRDIWGGRPSSVARGGARGCGGEFGLVRGGGLFAEAVVWVWVGEGAFGSLGVLLSAWAGGQRAERLKEDKRRRDGEVFFPGCLSWEGKS